MADNMRQKTIRIEKEMHTFNDMGLKFWNNEVLQNTNGVLAVIRENCLSHPPLNFLPSREGKVTHLK
jgi:very-short-patch-repair endonuclease